MAPGILGRRCFGWALQTRRGYQRLAHGRVTKLRAQQQVVWRLWKETNVHTHWSMGWESGDGILRPSLVGKDVVFAQKEELVTQQAYSTKSSFQERRFMRTTHSRMVDKRLAHDECCTASTGRDKWCCIWSTQTYHACGKSRARCCLPGQTPECPHSWLEQLAASLPWRCDASIKLTRHMAILQYSAVKQLPVHLQESKITPQRNRRWGAYFQPNTLISSEKKKWCKKKNHWISMILGNGGSSQWAAPGGCVRASGMGKGTELVGIPLWHLGAFHELVWRLWHHHEIPGLDAHWITQKMIYEFPKISGLKTLGVICMKISWSFGQNACCH